MHKKGSEARGSKNWWPVRPFRYFKFTLFVSKLATLTLFRRCTITNDVAKSSTFSDITARLAMTRSIYVAQLSTLLLLLCCSSRTASAAAVRVWNSRSAVHRADCLSCERSDLALPPHLRLTPPLWTEKNSLRPLKFNFFTIHSSIFVSISVQFEWWICIPISCTVPVNKQELNTPVFSFTNSKYDWNDFLMLQYSKYKMIWAVSISCAPCMVEILKLSSFPT